ncbi:hypothetical protein HY490_04940 [Candidatus Woesearchaeota archaeon]|nr:hypothetical protein [Candidatus Woesearchaeota archaeon]
MHSAPAALSLAQPAHPNRQYDNLYLSHGHREYFVPDSFVIQQSTVFVGHAMDVELHAREAFEKTTGVEFPENIIITVGTKAQLKQVHESRAGRWDDSIVGFSLNGQSVRPHEVFVLEGSLDRVMLTLGHEIGHVLSPTLPDMRDEEAKAFAFSLAWIRTIVDHNIAGLSNCINPNPAKNGLHDVAFSFVSDKLKEGHQPLSLFKQLKMQEVSIRQKLETIILN